MANTFKLVTKAGVTSADVIYTVAGSTTTVLLGIMLGNTTSSQVTATVTIESDTSSRAGANNEANQNVELVTNAPIPAGSSLELLAGNKVVMETTDVLKLPLFSAAGVTVPKALPINITKMLLPELELGAALNVNVVPSGTVYAPVGS